MNTLFQKHLVWLKPLLVNGMKWFVYFCYNSFYRRGKFQYGPSRKTAAPLSMECIYFLFAKRYATIKLSEIEYIKGNESGVFIVTRKHTWEFDLGLKELEWLLPPNRFCRIHSFYLVCLEAVVGYDKNKIFLRDRELPLAPAFRRRFDCKLEALLHEDVNEEYIPEHHFSHN